jgi:hypothetical protein
MEVSLDFHNSSRKWKDPHYPFKRFKEHAESIFARSLSKAERRAAEVAGSVDSLGGS